MELFALQRATYKRKHLMGGFFAATDFQETGLMQAYLYTKWRRFSLNGRIVMKISRLSLESLQLVVFWELIVLDKISSNCHIQHEIGCQCKFPHFCPQSYPQDLWMNEKFQMG